jgi:hypothetical protein
MKNRRMIWQMAGLTLAAGLFLYACAAIQPASTPVPPTLTPRPTLTSTPTLTPKPTLTPTPKPTEYPIPRGYISMAYDSESKQVIPFGGITGDYGLESSYNDETWAYDTAANRWTQMKPPSAPTKRGAVDLAYDSKADRVILFGGSDENTLGFSDTWAYDFNTNSWKELAKGPAHHLGARLAYDAESDRTILFGGFNVMDEYNGLYNDTWAYDYNSNTWTEMKPSASPPARNYQAMTYDSKADRVLVWGGTYTLHDGVWAYDYNKNTWTEMKPGGGPNPSAREYPAMAYDANADRTIMFGGTMGGTETWAFDYNNNTWTKMASKTVPDQISRHAVVYSPAIDRLILFGGQVGISLIDFTNETWTFDFNTNTWTNVTLHP